MTRPVLHASTLNEVTKSFYEFEHFRVDAMRRLLLREGVPVRLTSKAFETLLVLVRNSGRIISKDEMISAIWPDSYVDESNLTQNIFMLRRILGEGKYEHRYIATIPGVGYRFVCRVIELESLSDARRVSTEEPQMICSVAVLPFKPLSENEDDKFWGVGLADALIMRLSSLKGIKVLSTSAVLRMEKPIAGPLSAGSNLGVDALLDGLYQHDGERLRVSVQLVRARDCITLWAAKFDEVLTNFFAVQDSIAERVACALAIKLSGDEHPHLAVAWDAGKERFRRCS
jgi:DNA-binding winged helix-turn-helix (wHTH) protein